MTGDAGSGRYFDLVPIGLLVAAGGTWLFVLPILEIVRGVYGSTTLELDAQRVVITRRLPGSTEITEHPIGAVGRARLINPVAGARDPLGTFLRLEIDIKTPGRG